MGWDLGAKASNAIFNGPGYDTQLAATAACGHEFQEFRSSCALSLTAPCGFSPTLAHLK